MDDDDISEADLEFYLYPASPCYPQKYYPQEYHNTCLEKAQLALKYYNNEHGTNYELVESDALKSNGFLDGGIRWHCNFEATLKMPPKCDGDGKELFFAESNEDKVVTCCCPIIDKKIVGCMSCNHIIHPAHGFLAGVDHDQPLVISSPKSLNNEKMSNDSDLSSILDDGTTWNDPLHFADHDVGDVYKYPASPCYPQKYYPEEYHNTCLEKAQLALKYYNNEHGTNYELVESDALKSNGFLDGGIRWHCNFEATLKMPPKCDGDGKELFFAEFNEDKVVTCCCPIKDKKIVGCMSCNHIIHPTHGFLAGVDHDQPLIISSSKSPNNKKMSNDSDLRYSTSTYNPEVDYKEQSHNICLKEAQLALKYYNNKHGTKYEFVDSVALKCDGFLEGGVWFHCNFEAKLNLHPKLDGVEISSTKLFFAEINDEVVTACCPLKGKKNVGCKSCNRIIHPNQGFRRGR